MNIWCKIRDLVCQFRGLAVIGFTDIISNIVAGLFWLYLASLLGEESYGKISYFLAMGGIASTISLVGASNTITVYTAKKIRIESSFYLISLVCGFITSIIVFFVVGSYEISVYIFSSVIFGLAISEILGKKLYKEYLKFILLQKAIMICSAIILYYIIGINGIILGLGISFLPYSVIIIRVIRKSKIQISILKSNLEFIINNYILSLSGLLNGSIDKLIIVPLFSFAVLGNYQLALQFLMIFQTLPVVVYKYTLSHDVTGNPNIKLKKLTVLISLGITIIVIILSPIIIPILFPTFTNVIRLIQIMSIALIPISISYAYTSNLLANEKSRIILISSGLFFAVEIILIYLFGRSLNVDGIAIAYVSAMITQSSFLIFINKKIKCGLTKV